MKKYLRLLIASFAILFAFSGCGNIASNGAESTSKIAISSAPQAEISQSTSQASSQSSSQSSSQKPQSPSQASSQKPQSSSPASTQKTAPDEHGTYDSAQDVADYLLYYHKLPENYMTKKEARKQGWESGPLHKVIPGKCIGGDVYSNFEGNLPKNTTYKECDIDTLNAKSRGSKRLVWSADFKIYYTKDHYETFELIGEEK